MPEHIPLWISHRGYAKVHDENTLASFSAALDRGFRAFETDLRLTRDGHIVLLHDPDLVRAAGDPRRVCDLTRSDLNGIRLVRGGRPLFLDEFIEEFTDLSWVLDIKPEKAAETIASLAAWTIHAGVKGKLIEQGRFVTWRSSHEAAIARDFPDARFYARRAECWRAGLAVIAGLPYLGGIRPGRTYSLSEGKGRGRVFRCEIVRPFQARGARTLAFLPASDHVAAAAARAGFDEILTDGDIVAARPPAF